jgi:hypothetical protein
VSESEQARLFPADRFSPVTLAAWMILPASNARVFGVATCIGRSIRRDSTFAPLRHGKDVVGVLIQRPQRRAIQEHLKITGAHWRYLVAEWASLNLAHRCARDVVCLFIRPFENPCPYCKAEVPLGAKRSHDKRKAQPRQALSAADTSAFEHDSGDATG